MLSKDAKVYVGLMFGVMGGLLIGLGLSLLWTSQYITENDEGWADVVNLLMDAWRTHHPSDDIPTYHLPSEVYHWYADAQLFGAALVFTGTFLGLAVLYLEYSLLKTVSPQSPVATRAGKKHCRYCGIENKSDAVFCEKCGKKIT